MAKELVRSEFESELISEELKEVEKVLYEEARSEVYLVNEVSNHLLGSGGKRFRSSLVLLSSKLCGYEGREHVLCAAAVEYAHTATLLHDDVVDEARCRRGRPSANQLWGNEASVLVGDFLLFQGFQILMQIKNLRIMDLVTEIAIRMAEGETEELAHRGRLDISEDSYFSVITDKTAVLMSAACQIGAILGSAKPAFEKALADFGLNIGIAFQLVDDALDYTGDESFWGKEVGKDFNEAKATLPMLHCWQSSPALAKSRIEKFFKKRCRLKSQFHEVLGYLAETNSIAYTLDKARNYIEKAKDHLELFPDSPAKQALLAMADYVVERRI
jgi:octaprenyl-diphosphate synthase